MKRDLYPLALLGTVLLATVVPARGALAAALPFAVNAAVMLVLFLHGLRLSRAALLAGAGHWRLHLLILAITYLAFPAMVLALRESAPGLLPAPLWGGMVFLALLPSTVQSAIAFTAIARGNVAAAVCSATLSNLLGVVVTPLYAALLLNAEGGGLGADKVLTIAGLIVAPAVIGHALRPWLADWAARQAATLRLADRGAILLIVYGAFSAAVLSGLWRQAPLPSLLTVAALCLALFLAAFALALAAARLPGIAAHDRPTLAFAASHKSLATGAPIAGALFPVATVGVTILPLMLYHQLQLLISAWIAARWGRTAEAA